MSDRLIAFSKTSQAKITNRGVNYEVRVGQRSKQTRHTEYHAILLITAIGFITYPSFPFTSVRGHVMVAHFSRGRSTRSRKWAKRGESRAEKENKLSPFKSLFISKCKLPLNRSVGVVLPLFGASPLIGLCAPWRHRVAGVTYNFKHAEL